MAAPDGSLGRADYIIGADTAPLHAAVSESVAAVKEGMAVIDSQEANPDVGLTMDEFYAKRKEIDRELKQIAAMKAEASADLDTKLFDARAAELLAKKKQMERAIDVPVNIDNDSLRGAQQHLRGLSKELRENESHLGGWFKSLTRIRIHLGVMSLTVRQFGIVLTTLGPIIMHLVGAASALAGVLGTTLVGAFATGGALLTGFGLSAIGAFMALKPYTAELGGAFKAQSDYNEAVRTYGKGSEEAKSKQEELNKVLKATSPEARNIVKDFGSLRSEWGKMTSGVRAPLFDTISEGLRTARSLMPDFAKQTTSTFRVAAAGAREWLRDLRSPQARQALNDIMGNFRSALPDLMAGLGELGAMFGRVFASAAKNLPELAGGFRQWAESLSQSVGRGASLDQRMSRLIDHMQDFGHFAQASGRLITTFFNAGADSGANLLQTMTRVFNRWSDWMQTTEGRNSLASFFDRSATGASHLMGLLAPLAGTLVNIATITEPISNAMLRLSGAIASVVEKLTSFGPTAAILRVVGSILASYFVASRFVAAAHGIGQMVTATRAWAAANLMLASTQRATAISGGAAAAGSIAGNAAVAGWAGQARGATQVAASAGRARTMMMGLSGFMGGPLVGALTLAGAAFLTFGGSIQSTDDKIAEARQEIAQTTAELAQLPQYANTAAVATNSLKQAKQEEAAAWQRVNQLTAQGKTNTQQYKDALMQATQATANAKQVQRDRNAALAEAQSSQEKVNDALENYKNAQSERNIEDYGALRLLAQQRGNLDELIDTYPEMEEGLQAYNAALQQHVINTTNAQRAAQGLPAITQKAAETFTQLRQTLGKPIQTKIGLIADPRMATKIARVSSELARAGQGRDVKLAFKLLGDDPTKLLTALRQINQTRLNPKNLQFKETGGGTIMNLLRSFSVFRLPNKIQRFIPEDSPLRSAWSWAQSIAGTILPAIIQPIRGQKQGFWGAIGDLFGFGYSGGVFPAARGTDPRNIEKAYDMATNRRTEHATGQIVTRPTLLTGEENRREYVIATNPTYRNRNEDFLKQAAHEFGFALIETAAQGKGVPYKKKPNKGGGGGGNGPQQGALDAYQSRYEELHNDLAKWEKEYELDRRAYDLGSPSGQGGFIGGTAIADLEHDLWKQHGILGLFPSVIQKMLDLQPATKVKGPKKTKTKAQKKAAKKAERQNAKIDAYNSDLDSAKSVLKDELRDIPYQQNALLLDIYELQNAASQNAIAGSSISNQARFDLFKQFSSNFIPSGPSMTTGGFGANFNASGVAPTPSFASTAGSFAATMNGGTATRAGGTTVNQTNHFAAPPPDPHTFTQTVLYEAQAVAP